MLFYDLELNFHELRFDIAVWYMWAGGKTATSSNTIAETLILFHEAIKKTRVIFTDKRGCQYI